MRETSQTRWTEETRLYIQAEARKIARAYARANRADDEKQAPQRKDCGPLPPRNRPLAELKRSIYRLACEIDRRRASASVGGRVRERDRDWGIEHRPRNPTVIDWTVRLVRGRLLGKPPAIGIKNPKRLFDDVTQTRLCTELNFAFRHSILTEAVSMFIDEFGGHKMIGPMVAAGKYDFRKEEWLSELQRRTARMGPEALAFYEEGDDDVPPTTLPKHTSKERVHDPDWDD